MRISESYSKWITDFFNETPKHIIAYCTLPDTTSNYRWVIFFQIGFVTLKPRVQYGSAVSPFCGDLTNPRIGILYMIAVLGAIREGISANGLHPL